jgi:phage shock protein A
MLKAQYQRAQATKHIQETLAGLKESNALETFARMEERIQQVEAEAEAATEMAEETGDTLAHRFDRMEVQVGAEDDLVTLKQRMGIIPPPEAPPPQPEAVRVDAGVPSPADELTELTQKEQEELATALAELEEQEQAQQARMKR